MTTACAWCEQCMALNGVKLGDYCSHHHATVASEMPVVYLLGGELTFLCEHKHQAAPPRERRLRRRSRRARCDACGVEVEAYWRRGAQWREHHLCSSCLWGRRYNQAREAARG